MDFNKCGWVFSKLVGKGGKVSQGILDQFQSGQDNYESSNSVQCIQSDGGSGSSIFH
jgi:hypothetical protein